MHDSSPLSRREVLQHLGALGATAMFAGRFTSDDAAEIIVAGKSVEITVWSLSATTARIIVTPIENGTPAPIAATGALVDPQPGRSVARTRDSSGAPRVRAGDLTVRFTDAPPTLHIETARGELLQTLVMDAATPGVSFLLGSGPLLGLGEGGPQFDRRGSTDPMRNGQGGFRLATHGTRAPVQWLIGTADGWAMFIHQPYGAFDFTGERGKFTPPEGAALPLDVFVIGSRDPKVIMREYARITGFPEIPPRWAFGYMQSSRTLAGPDEILGVARTFRDKQLPCDALIWLGTEFAPSGWNTRNGEFTWHKENFPNPKEMMDTLHAQNFRTIVHVVIEGRRLTGSVSDACTAPALPSGRTEDNRWPPDRQVSCYWPVHKEVADVGVDGWWPDQGDGLDGPSRLNRHRMYWEGMQQLRPNVRPFALHRNASAGIQRFGGFIWSGDVQARWETLATHIAVAINTGLSGFPYWGTDIGGFNPTAEYTGELHARWFQFGAFCPSFRSHGRNWHLKLPWGWDGGDGGPFEAGQWRAAPEELRNKDVEAVARKYLNLRYKLMPYTYTAVRQSHDTGLPVMRGLWLHHADDPVAVARGDEFLWGEDILVAPVVEKGATSRKVYLPRGLWYDFWTNDAVEGGREIERAVDILTMPLYVRAGAVLPLGTIKQYVDEPTDQPLTLVVYPGVDGTRTMYDDDGNSFNYRRGEWMGLQSRWNDRARTLTIELARGSKMLSAKPLKLAVRVVGSAATREIEFAGRRIVVRA